jgi:hypothetical protein
MKKTSLVEKARLLQEKIDNKIHHLPSPSLEGYLFFMTYIFFFMGIALALVFWLYNINPLEGDMLSSPIHYFGLAITLMMFYLLVKKKSLQ